MVMINPLISSIKLKKILDDNNLKILDSRWFLDDNQKGLRI